MKKNLKILIPVTGATILSLHIANRIIISSSTSKEYLQKRKKNFFSWKFGQIHYTKKGTGKPILLIHDLTPGSSGYEFYKIESELAKTNEVYVIDLLGYGLSDQPNLTYTNFLYVEMISEFIKSIIGKKTNIITSGDSSSLAVMVCQMYPDIINQIIMINPQDLRASKMIPNHKSKMLKFLIELPIVGTFTYNVLYNKKNITNQFLNNYFYNAGKINQTDIDTYCESVHYKNDASKYVIASYLGRYINMNITHALSKINHNISILSGMEKENAGAITEQYCNYNPSIEHYYIEDTKKLPHMEKPQKTIETISLFLGSDTANG